MRNLIFIFILISMSYSAHGIGMGRESGGGSYALIDGRAVISDPYYAGVPVSKIEKITPASFHDLPKEVQAYVSQIERFLNKYYHSFRGETTLRKFFDGIVRTETQEYFLVPATRENNVPCEHYLPKLNREVDDHFQYGCTFGNQTYLFVDKWRQASIENQAYAIIHERLWAANPQADQRDIATFVGWTQKFETRYIQQIQFNDRSLLSEKEMQGYSEWFQASKKIGFGILIYNLRVLPGGGVILSSCPEKVQVSNSFVGVGTRVYVNCETVLSIQNSVILGSHITYGMFAHEKSYVISNSTIIDGNLNINNIRESKIFASDIDESFLANSNVKQSKLNETTSMNSEIIDSKIRYARVHNSQVSSSELVSVDSTFGVIKNSPNANMMTLNGLSDSLIFLDNVDTYNIKKSRKTLIIESGSNLKNIEFQTGEELFAVKIGKNAILENIIIGDTTTANNGYRYATYDLIVEPRTKIRNGQIMFAPGCKIFTKERFDVPSRSANNFYIGAKGLAREYELSNKVINIKTKRFSCSARFE